MRMPTARAARIVSVTIDEPEAATRKAMKAKTSSTIVKAVLPMHKLGGLLDTKKSKQAGLRKAAKHTKCVDAEEMMPSGTECVFGSVEPKTNRSKTAVKQAAAKKTAALVNVKRASPASAEKVSPKKKDGATDELQVKKTVAKRKVGDFLTGKPPRVSAIQAATIENPKKKIKVRPQEEKSLAAERELALMALELTDLDDLLQGDARKGEPVSGKIARLKDEMAAKPVPELKQLCNSKSLKHGGAKGELVKRLLEHAKDELKAGMVQAILEFEAHARKEYTVEEAKARDEARAQANKVRQVVSSSKADVAAKSAEELNQMLINYGLNLGGSKDEKVERIVFAKMLAAMARDVRKQEMLNMSADGLLEMCSKAKEVFDDRLVKEVMVDRLLLCEQ